MEALDYFSELSLMLPLKLLSSLSWRKVNSNSILSLSGSVVQGLSHYFLRGIAMFG